MGAAGRIPLILGVAPTFTARKGTLAVDSVGQDSYVNLAGSTWQRVNIAASTFKGLQTVFIDTSPNRQWGYSTASNGANAAFCYKEPRSAGSFLHLLNSRGPRSRYQVASTSNGAEGTFECPDSTGIASLIGFPHALMLNTELTFKFRWNGTTNIRYYALLCDTRMDSVVDSTDPAAGVSASYVGLRFSTDIDSNFMFVLGDGTTQTVQDTLIAGDSATRFLQILMSNSGPSITVRLFSVDGVTELFSHTFTTGLMAAATALSWQLGDKNLAAGLQPGIDLYSAAGTNRMNP